MHSSLSSRGRNGCAMLAATIAVLFSLVIVPEAKAAHRVSVLDFEVQSDNPQYKYLGACPT